MCELLSAVSAHEAPAYHELRHFIAFEWLEAGASASASEASNSFEADSCEESVVELSRASASEVSATAEASTTEHFLCSPQRFVFLQRSRSGSGCT